MIRLTLALILFAAPALAETAKAPDLDPDAISRPGPVARLYLAQELFLQGLATRDPLALIQSARMMQRVGIIPAPDRIPVASGKKLKGDDPPPVPLPDALATLATAAALAGDDDALMTLIDNARQEQAVPCGAVRRAAAALPPGGTEVWTIAFFGADPAELAVIGNGQGNLSITVADAAGVPVCSITTATDRLYCRFTPAQNADFTITVANPGKTVDAYMVITN